METIVDNSINDIEIWLALPYDGFNTMEDAISCELAESGADRELDFDLEREQEKRYDTFLVNHATIKDTCVKTGNTLPTT